MMISAFAVSLLAVVLAEMGDKTQLLAMAFAGKYNWRTVLWAVLCATLLNHFFAVALGNAVSSFMPMEWLKLAAALSFIGLGLWTICADKLSGEDKASLRSPFWTVAIAFFFAEIGDKTQIMTMTIAADEAIKIGGSGIVAKLQQTMPVLAGSTLGMIIADGIGIIVGVVMHKHIPEKGMRWIAALVFVLFGFLGLHEALDHLLPKGADLHHKLILACVPVVALAMWMLDRMEAKQDGTGEMPVEESKH